VRGARPRQQAGVGERRQINRSQDREHGVARLPGHGKAMVEAAAARACGGDHQAVERRPALFVLVEAVAHEVPEEPPALRVAKANDALQKGRILAQRGHAADAKLEKRGEVANGGQPESRQWRAACLIHPLIQTGIEPGRQAHRAPIRTKLPALARDDLGRAVNRGADGQRGILL